MRRRKPRVVWLPVTAVNGFGSTDTVYNAAQIVLPTAETGATASIEFPVVTDGNVQDPSNPNSSLADIEQSGYRLRRIVGKIYCFHEQGSSVGHDPLDLPSFTFVTAGFIVRRVSPDGASLANQLALNTSNPLLTAPGAQQNAMDPWIWRRTWLLGARGIDPAVNLDAGPPRNYGDAYPGGNSEGPHVNQKTARIVGPEERLFLNISATVFVQGANPAVGVVVGTAWEMRVLASMRSNVGNRRNASR